MQQYLQLPPGLLYCPTKSSFLSHVPRAHPTHRPPRTSLLYLAWLRLRSRQRRLQGWHTGWTRVTSSPKWVVKMVQIPLASAQLLISMKPESTWYLGTSPALCSCAELCNKHTNYWISCSCITCFLLKLSEKGHYHHHTSFSCLVLWQHSWPGGEP